MMSNGDDALVVYEIGISELSYNAIRNIFDDYGIDVVRKDSMNIVVFVDDSLSGKIINGRLPVIGTNVVEFYESDGKVYGTFPIGDALNQLNDTIGNLATTLGYSYDEYEADLFVHDDELTFLVVDEIDDKQRIDGKLTRLATSMTEYLGKEHLIFSETNEKNTSTLSAMRRIFGEEKPR